MSITYQSLTSPPCFPARPVNGGPLPKALPKTGQWVYEPKVNGWRAWVHMPTGGMFNRRNEPLSISHEFKPVLKQLQTWWHDRTDKNITLGEWLDTEAFERRHPLGRGSLVILDAPISGTYEQRQHAIYHNLTANGPARGWQVEQQYPAVDSLLTFAYSYEDEATQRAGGATVIDPAIYPAEAWLRLQKLNKTLGCELFEGLVAKRKDSTYPLQNLSSDREFPFWMKHRWSF